MELTRCYAAQRTASSNLSQASILSTQPLRNVAAQGERKLLPPAHRDASIRSSANAKMWHAPLFVGALLCVLERGLPYTIFLFRGVT